MTAGARAAEVGRGSDGALDVVGRPVLVGGAVVGGPVAAGGGSPVSETGSVAPAIVVDGVSKVYRSGGAAVPALDQVSLAVAEGEFVCLVGASGCGKTTILNLIAGLDQPSQGRITRPPGQVAMMFQDAALFPWLTVSRNVELALQLGGKAADKVTSPATISTGFRRPRGRVGRRAERRADVAQLLDLVHLGPFAGKRPHELSGGMRQRVALARALAQRARVLLMDEPFGSLDAITRDLLHDELERIWRDTGMTIVMVTHNVREAVRLGDRVLLLSSRPGRVAAEFPVHAPRPRRIESPEVASTASVIVDRLREEVARHARR